MTLRVPLPERHIDGGNYEFGAQVIFHRPADHLPRARIQRHRQVHKAHPCGNVGDVGHPEPVELEDPKVPLDQIGRQNHVFFRRRGPYEASPRYASQSRQPHQPGHALAADVNAVLQGKFRVDAGSSVALLREAVDGVNLRGQPYVLKGALTGWSIAPSVIAARRDPEQSAHNPYPVGGLVCLYESVERFVFGALSWANQAAAFERISRSSLSWRFSRFSRVNSWRSALVNPPLPGRRLDRPA